MMKTVNAILAPENSFLVLNLYSNGFSPMMGETVVREAFGLQEPGFSVRNLLRQSLLRLRCAAVVWLPRDVRIMRWSLASWR